MFSFTKLKNEDLSMLFSWLKREHIIQYWGEPLEEDKFNSKYEELIDSKIVTPYIVHLKEAAFAYIQVYEAAKVGDGWWENEPEGTFGIDQFIADKENLGKKLGRAFMSEFTNDLLKNESVKRIITDPSPENIRAIKAYKAAGFREVGLITTPDGPAIVLEKDQSSSL